MDPEQLEFSKKMEELRCILKVVVEEFLKRAEKPSPHRYNEFLVEVLRAIEQARTGAGEHSRSSVTLKIDFQQESECEPFFYPVDQYKSNSMVSQSSLDSKDGRDFSISSPLDVHSSLHSTAERKLSDSSLSNAQD